MIIRLSAGLVDFGGGEDFLHLRDEEGAALASPQAFHLVVERGLGELAGFPCGLDSFLDRFNVGGGIAHEDHDVLFDLLLDGFRLGLLQPGGAVAAAFGGEGERNGSDDAPAVGVEITVL